MTSRPRHLWFDGCVFLTSLMLTEPLYELAALSFPYSLKHGYRFSASLMYVFVMLGMASVLGDVLALTVGRLFPRLVYKKNDTPESNTST